MKKEQRKSRRDRMNRIEKDKKIGREQCKKGSVLVMEDGNI